MQIKGNRLQVFKVSPGLKKNDYVTVQDFSDGQQVQFGIDKSEARNLKPGDFVDIDGPVYFGEYNGKMFATLPLGTLRKAKAAA